MMKRRASSLDEESNIRDHPGKKRDYDERELRRISVVIQRKIDPERHSDAPIRRSVSSPEKIVIVRKRGEGSRPIFDRVELYQNAKDRESRPKERRKVVKVLDGLDRMKRKKTLSLSPVRTSELAALDADNISHEKTLSSAENKLFPSHQNVESEKRKSKLQENSPSKFKAKTRETTNNNTSTHREKETRESTNTTNNTHRETHRETVCIVPKETTNNTRETRESTNTHRETICIVPMMHQLRPVGHLLPRGPMPAPYCILPPRRLPPPLPPLFRPPLRHPFPPRMRPPPPHYY